MREVLFRGKRIDTNTWVYGLYIGEPKEDDTQMLVPIRDTNRVEILHVKKETISEYTGLCDKNGTKIFEGDVVRCNKWHVGGSPTDTVNLQVWYGDGGFAAGTNPLNSWLYDSARGNVMLEDVEVIGNIYDNPELIPSCQ